MYLTLSRKVKAAICCIAATTAHAGGFNFQPDATRRTPLSVHHYLLQEVTVIPIPARNEKAAGAAAAFNAQMSAITGSSIVPPLRRNGMGFRLFPPKITLRSLFPHIKPPLQSPSPGS